MDTTTQRERAERFRALHRGAPLLVLPNVWDAASARMVEQAGFPALATTSGGMAAALGYPDGQRVSREQMIEALARITRVATAPVSADIEAGFGANVAQVTQTVRAVIATGVVGVNIEDSTPGEHGALTPLVQQVELIVTLRALATALSVPFVINARVDAFIREVGDPADRFALAVERANAYLEAGADCVYPIGLLDYETIARLVAAIRGPVNIMGAPSQPTLRELERLGVARVSLASGLLRAALGHVRALLGELRASGGYDALQRETLSGAELSALFASTSAPEHE